MAGFEIFEFAQEATADYNAIYKIALFDVKDGIVQETLTAKLLFAWLNEQYSCFQHPGMPQTNFLVRLPSIDKNIVQVLLK